MALRRLCCCCCPEYKLPDEFDALEMRSVETTPAVTPRDGRRRPVRRTSSIEFWVPGGNRVMSVQPKTEYHDVDAISIESNGSGLSLDNATYEPFRVNPMLPEVRHKPVTVQPLGSLDPTLYETIEKDKKVSQLKITHTRQGSTDEAKEDIFGTVWSKIHYDAITERLVLRLQRISDLPRKGDDKLYDPVAFICLLPDEKHYFRSKVIRNTCNPCFEDEFAFPLEKVMEHAQDLLKCVLRISVYDYNRTHKYNVIGHALFPLADQDLSGRNTVKAPITKRSKITVNLGEVLLSLAYLPSLDRLSVVVNRCRHLKIFDKSVTSIDTYAKVTLMCGSDKVKSKRTEVVENTSKPVFNQSLSFVVPYSYLDDTSLVITVMQRTFLRSDAVIGRLVVGPFFYAQGESLTHWGSMAKSREAKKQWHPLYL
ncbi:synaptotagmin-15-like [Branchiostoma floridae]|uniref:Synaptotagmin-15-like n=2 Tax=Branchiostoma floridae TaxID=7739 RepID=A0A9J7MLM5_BRAFL|nr:synaptotagmin-15-like [Branchiostoma floridae]